MSGSSILEGYKCLSRKDLKRAHGIFTETLAQTRDKKEIYDLKLGLAITYRELGDLQKATEIMNEAIEMLPNPKVAMFDMGNLYEEMGEHALAIQNFDMAITIDPNFSDAYINRGVSWYNMGNLEQAKRDFRNALENDKRSSRALSNMGTVNLDEKDYHKAIDFFDRSLEIDPENIHSLCGKGLALFHMDRYDESIICFDASASINPDFYIAHYYKGHILKRLDLLEDAEEAIKEALEVREEYPLAWFELGEIYRMKNDRNKALTAYEKAIKYHGSSFEEALFQKGKILMEKNRITEAINCYKMICKVNPYIPKVWRELGLAISRTKGNQEKAIAALKNSLYLDQKDPETIFNLAKLLIAKGSGNKAMKLLEEGMEKAPDPHIALLLSGLYYQYEEYNDAIITAQDALSKDPELLDSWLVMGRSYGELGKTEEYKQCLRKYLHKEPEDKAVTKEMESIG